MCVCHANLMPAHQQGSAKALLTIAGFGTISRGTRHDWFKALIRAEFFKRVTGLEGMRIGLDQPIVASDRDNLSSLRKWDSILAISGFASAGCEMPYHPRGEYLALTLRYRTRHCKKKKAGKKAHMKAH